jgi:hypothetical protein
MDLQSSAMNGFGCISGRTLDSVHDGYLPSSVRLSCLGKPHLCFGTETTKIWCEDTKMAPPVTLRCQHGFLATTFDYGRFGVEFVDQYNYATIHVVFDDMFSTVL